MDWIPEYYVGKILMTVTEEVSKKQSFFSDINEVNLKLLQTHTA